jgi:hypothetical protein
VILRLFGQGVNQYNKGDKNRTPYLPPAFALFVTLPFALRKEEIFWKNLLNFLHVHGKAKRWSCSEVKTGRSKQ